MFRVDTNCEIIPDYSYFSDKNNEFTLIEEEQSVDIQSLKEFEVGDTYIDSLHDAENEIRYLQMGYNNLLKIAKQLDRQINNK